MAPARARRVLPAPGGPEMSRLWWPAIAMVRARLARSWPWMWSRRTGGGELEEMDEGEGMTEGVVAAVEVITGGEDEGVVVNEVDGVVVNQVNGVVVVFSVSVFFTT